MTKPETPFVYLRIADDHGQRTYEFSRLIESEANRWTQMIVVPRVARRPYGILFESAE
jgi:hypothetical protein